MVKVQKSYVAPFGIAPEMRLPLVKRWTILAMSREQSVAEHSYGVAMITKHLCWMACLSDEETNALMVEALHHDVDEVYTGDIPSPAKVRSSGNKLTDKILKETNPIVKLADCIESLTFFKKYCIDSCRVKKWIEQNLYNNMIESCKKTDLNLSEVITLAGNIQ